MAWQYSEKTKQLFMAAVHGEPGTHLGEIEDPDGFGEHGSIVCGDALKLTIKLDEHERIKDAKFQVLGCPGAVAAAMATVDLVKGKTLQESVSVNDHDIFCELKQMPDLKLHCIRLAVKPLQKAIADCREKNQQDH